MHEKLMKVQVLPPRHPLTVRDKQTAAFSEVEETEPNPQLPIQPIFSFSIPGEYCQYHRRPKRPNPATHLPIQHSSIPFLFLVKIAIITGVTGVWAVNIYE